MVLYDALLTYAYLFNQFHSQHYIHLGSIRIVYGERAGFREECPPSDG